jgi:hypothetical protein
MMVLAVSNFQHNECKQKSLCSERPTIYVFLLVVLFEAMLMRIFFLEGALNGCKQQLCIGS